MHEIVRSPGEGLGVEYWIRLAPYNIARVRLERLGPRSAHIDWVHVPPAYRSQGLGGVLLARVLRDADKEGVTVTLVARACGTLAQDKLERWYEAYGFVREKTTRDGVAMRRPARARSARLRRRVA